MPDSIKQKEKETVGRDKGSIETLVNTLSSLKDTAREGARHALVAMGKEVVPSLIEALKSKNSLMRWEAAKALGEIRDPESAPAMVEALEDDEFDVRWLAAEGLIEMNVKGLKPLLQALVSRGDSFRLREGAHHVFHDLAKGELRKYLTPVLTALDDIEPSMEVPWAARRALQKLQATNI